MSDDDWEKEVDDIVENKKEEVKTTKFDDEDKVDSDEEEKKAAEALKAQATNAQPRIKQKKLDVDQLWEANQKKKTATK